MDIIESLNSRRSIRAFKSEPVTKELLEKILESAKRSPSYTNTQPWEIAVVTGKKRDELSQMLCDKAMANIPTNHDIPSPKGWPEILEKRAKEHITRRANFLGVDRTNKEQTDMLRLQNLKFYGAPCVIILYIDKSLTSWSILDAGMFVHGLLLAAHSAGLGTCPQASVVGYPDEIRKCLDIPDTKILLLAISIGYPDNEALVNKYQSIREGLDKFVRWFGFDKSY